MALTHPHRLSNAHIFAFCYSTIHFTSNCSSGACEANEELLATHVVAFLSSICSSPLPFLFLVSDSSSNPTSDKLSSPSSNPILRSLTPSLTEVDHIFSYPLEAMLDPQLILNNGEPLVGDGEGYP
ncbi:hypothetical protein AZE42_12806 [Rhizopogon vesiculosus]|uniref:Uncharacterized protein n=1 Tax=Rhizopogon vesiculosus TaxID=180088 RepID=A0A1J8PKU2_9AGAM|nr:hypothetical protein AZE42_12806 [Rhizopogon vesiculosus]